MPQKSFHEESLREGRKTESFVRDFLFGASGVFRDGRVSRANLAFDSRTEGWVGIPHGGIGMGAIAELATTLDAYPADSASRFPMSLEYRLGGSPARTGDVAAVEVKSCDGHIEGKINIGRDTAPYMTAVIRYGIEACEGKEWLSSFFPEDTSGVLKDWTPLPHYKDCFVCGTGRHHAGLKRAFHLWAAALPSKIIIAPVGNDTDDLETFCRFHANGLIHPLAFLALLDETVGWGGFMVSASGGVTVRIHFTFYRDIKVGERVLVYGRGDKVKGKASSRLLYWGSGGAAVVHDDGRLEPVIAVSGQFLGVPELTEQMKIELAPKALTEKAFELAGS
jgi:hypothetical protein